MCCACVQAEHVSCYAGTWATVESTSQCGRECVGEAWQQGYFKLSCSVAVCVRLSIKIQQHFNACSLAGMVHSRPACWESCPHTDLSTADTRSGVIRPSQDHKVNPHSLPPVRKVITGVQTFVVRAGARRQDKGRRPAAVAPSDGRPCSGLLGGRGGLLGAGALARSARCGRRAWRPMPRLPACSDTTVIIVGNTHARVLLD